MNESGGDKASPDRGAIAQRDGLRLENQRGRRGRRLVQLNVLNGLVVGGDQFTNRAATTVAEKGVLDEPGAARAMAFHTSSVP